MISACDRGAPPFSVGAVLRRSFSIFFKHPFVFIGLSFMAELPKLIVMFTMDNLRIVPSIDLTTLVIIQGVITCAVSETLRGNSARFGKSLFHGLCHPFLFWAGLCYTFFFSCLGFAVIFIAFPLFGRKIGIAIMVLLSAALWCKWSVGIPICIVERLGPVDSIKRSSELTKDCRLKLAGIYGLCIIFMRVITTVGTSGVKLFTATIMNNFDPAFSAYFVPVAEQFIFAVAMAFFHITTAVNYYGLREAKEGIDIEHMTRAFE